jgi:CubicO group peptidase (beta-lactamase class C family)
MLPLQRFAAHMLGIMLGLVVIAPSGSEIQANRHHVGTTSPAHPGQEVSRHLSPGNPREHGIGDADLDALRAILRKAIEDRTVPGVSLLVAHKGQIVFREAFGNLRLDQKVLMASSSKPVTATLLMILVDQGKLALDDPVGKYLPEFKGITIKGKPPVKPPTVRHLLCNMSGLPGDLITALIRERLQKRAPGGRPGDQTKDHERKAATAKGGENSRPSLFSARNRSLADSVRVLAERGLATEPGEEFHYCTMGFNAAARVAEVAGKRPFEELVQADLLKPLGMTDTRYVPVGLQALRARPTLPGGESRFIMAGGGLASTLDDFAAFYQMHLSGGVYQGRRILSDRAAIEMRTRQAKLELLMAGPYGNDYGLAFFLDRLDEKGCGHIVTHPGLFGTTPWLDVDREVVGVLLVQSHFLRVLSLARAIQTKVREIIPAPARQSR